MYYCLNRLVFAGVCFWLYVFTVASLLAYSDFQSWGDRFSLWLATASLHGYRMSSGRVMLSSGPTSRFPAFGVDDLCKRGLAGVGHGCTLVGG